MTSEDRQQIALFEWALYVRQKYPQLAMLFHIPNERRCTPAEGAILKRKGVKAGVPDLFLPVPIGGYHGLWIELKTETGQVSDAQNWWIGCLREYGYRVEVCRGALAAIDVIERYLNDDFDT